MDKGRRRRVTLTQLEILCEFVKSHKNIAMGFNKSCEARDMSRRMWMRVARTLNSQGEGAVKDWSEWAKYWVNYKAKLKQKMTRVENSIERTEDGLLLDAPLSEIDRKFLRIVGRNFGMGLLGLQVKPFEESPEPEQSEVESSDAILVLVQDSREDEEQPPHHSGRVSQQAPLTATEQQPLPTNRQQPLPARQQPLPAQQQPLPAQQQPLQTNQQQPYDSENDEIAGGGLGSGKARHRRRHQFFSTDRREAMGRSRTRAEGDSSRTLEDLVDVLKDIHQVLKRIESR